MSQSRGNSLVEAVSNTVIGFGINFILNLVVLPMFGFDVSPAAAFHMGLIFTVVSVARGYGVRRLFNNKRFQRVSWAVYHIVKEKLKWQPQK